MKSRSRTSAANCSASASVYLISSVSLFSTGVKLHPHPLMFLSSVFYVCLLSILMLFIRISFKKGKKNSRHSFRPARTCNFCYAFSACECFLFFFILIGAAATATTHLHHSVLLHSSVVCFFHLLFSFPTKSICLMCFSITWHIIMHIFSMCNP